MALPGTVTAAAAGVHGFDCDAVVSATAARELAALGYTFAIRYISRVTPQNAGDLTAGEADTILAAGLSLMIVQHCPFSLFMPSAELGIQYGDAAVANARDIGYPSGASLWLDLERIRPGSGPEAICAYANAWSRVVRGAGYLDGVYYSADCPLTPQQLYLDLVATRYWRGLSADSPVVPMRGACMQQFMQSGQTATLDIDRDVVMADAFGGLPMILAAASV